MRECSICSVSKNESEFYSQSRHSKKRGNYIYVNPECKKCTSERSDKWQKDNPEKHRENRLRHDRKEHRKQQHYEYNKNWINKGKHREYYKSNPDKAEKYRKNHRKHDVSNEEWGDCKNYFSDMNGDWCCAYCGLLQELHTKKYLNRIIYTDLHKDHVDDKGANDLSNCIPACNSCNSSKKQSPMRNWYMTRTFFDIGKLQKIERWLNSDYKIFINLKTEN